MMLHFGAIPAEVFPTPEVQHNGKHRECLLRLGVNILW